MKITKKQKSGEYGIIISALFALYAFLAKKAKNSITAKIFSTKEKTDGDNGMIAGFFQDLFSQKKQLKIRRRIAGVLCNNPVMKYIDKISDGLLSCRSRDYGIFFLSFGMYSILGSVVGKYFLAVDEQDLLSVILSVCCIIFSFPLIKEKQAICKSAFNNTALHFILYDLLGVRKHNIPEDATVAPAGLALLLGMGLGLLSFVTNTSYILFAVLCVLLSFFILRIPEAGVVTVFFVFLLLDTRYTAYAVILTLISYFFKLLQMKRTGKFGLTDFWILLLSFIFFVAGIFSQNKATELSISSFFILSFFLTKNLIRTFEWIKRCFMACVFSLTCVALSSLIQIISCNAEGIFKSVLYSAENGITSVFATSEHLAFYLLAMIPFAMVNAHSRKNAKEKRISSFVIFTSVVALLFTISYGAYFSALATLCIFLLIYSKKTFAGAFISVLPIITVYSIVSQFEKISVFNILKDAENIFAAFSQSLSTTLQYPLGGVGFSTEMSVSTPFYTALSAHLGIPCLIVFIIIVFMFIKHLVSLLCFKREGGMYAKYSYFISAPLISVTSLIIYGFFSSAALSPSGILILFMLMGLGFGVCEYVSCENDTLSEYGRRSE